jgi:hypothetical protein
MYCATKDLQVDVTGFSFCDVDDEHQIFFYDFINRATFHLQTFCSTVGTLRTLRSVCVPACTINLSNDTNALCKLATS